jgi:DNA-binding MarR family transcriptional regulator
MHIGTNESEAEVSGVGDSMQEKLQETMQEAGYRIDPLVEVIGFRLSTATVLFHAAVADRLGVNVTDVKCYSLIRQAATMSAGELAERTGLTTGAITGVVDRLEKAGLVRRARDGMDRRRVLLEIVTNPAHEAMLAQLYGPMGSAINELVQGYSEAERALLLDFTTRAIAILDRATSDLRAQG